MRVRPYERGADKSRSTRCHRKRGMQLAKLKERFRGAQRLLEFCE